MKILFITNLPSPYRVDFFNELGKHCDLTVIYERHSASDRDKKWVNYNNGEYKEIYLKNIKIGSDKSFGIDLIRYLKKKYFDKVIFCGFSSPAIMIGILYCRLYHIKYYIESDGGLFKQENYIKKRIKRFFLDNCEGVLTTCNEDIKSFHFLGVDLHKIKKYPFSSVKDEDIVSRILTRDEKKCIRKKLGISEDKVLICVGQYIKRKGFDLLIKAANRIPDVGIYLIGGRPTDEYLSLKETSGADNIHFVDFLTKNELMEYYDAGDIFVLPTREDIWGLVINEAMARALPVITTDMCNAGLELISQGENGYIICSDDVDSLAESVKDAFNSDLEKMSENSLKKIKGYTIENMVKQHLKILK